MKENSKASFLTLCLFLLLTIPLDRAVFAATDIVTSRGLNTNWFFGMNHAFQSAIVAIIPATFGYFLFKHIEELKESPTSEAVVMKAILAAVFVIMFTVAGYDFLSLAAEGRGIFNTETTENLILSSLTVGLIDGLMMGGFCSIICFAFIKRIQQKLISKNAS